MQKWLKRYRDGDLLSVKDRKDSLASGLTRSEQLNHILATHKLDELSLGKYCRENGIYTHQLTKWREEIMVAPKSVKGNVQQAELKKLKEENKKLQKELRRKEKALAEASALLIMKKKADLIWGDNEDD